ncbi:hypothetical protein ACGFYQ_27390 [Streptomyces sp. NPDC048258]|uniref:hypothetical protein n=1 Tax=Streptomyces sp. NPDC048258 TaxID=3365527 RepID=UPI0037199CFE
MADLSTFISQDFGSVASAVVALLAIPGVVIAGHIQGSKALKGAQAQAEKALEAAQAQAAATLETGRLQAQAAVASARELSREAHAQWQRDRCQEVWAEYVKELDVLLPKVEANNQEARSDELLKAYAMVELMSPPSVLAKAREVKDGALDFTTALYMEHLERENYIRLARARGQLGDVVDAGARISRSPNGSLAEQIQIGPDDWDVRGPESQEDFEDMSERFERGEIARAAVEALDEAEQAVGDDMAERRARQALVIAGVDEAEAELLAHSAGLDRGGQVELLGQRRIALGVLRDSFVEAARMELDALGR